MSGVMEMNRNRIREFEQAVERERALRKWNPLVGESLTGVVRRVGDDRLEVEDAEGVEWLVIAKARTLRNLLEEGPQEGDLVWVQLAERGETLRGNPFKRYVWRIG